MDQVKKEKEGGGKTIERSRKGNTNRKELHGQYIKEYPSSVGKGAKNQTGAGK